MSVDDPKVVDAIGVEKSSGHIVLTITDHHDWTNAREHMLVLQAKINTYLAFIESGEVFARYPDAKDSYLVICVVGKYPLSSEGTEFLAKVKLIVEDAGFGFRFEAFSHETPI